MVRRRRTTPRKKIPGQMHLPYGGQHTELPPTTSAVEVAPGPAKADLARGAAPQPAGEDTTAPLGHSRRKPRPPKLYRIGEVVEYSGKSRQTVHNYTTMGLLPESQWTKGGHRLYDESVFERLDQIAEMKVQGKSLEEIRNYFARGR